MITKFVLVVWIGLANSQTLSTQSFDTLAECEAVAAVLKTKMEDPGWYRCYSYSFEVDKK
jgi:hypothetical protein